MKNFLLVNRASTGAKTNFNLIERLWTDSHEKQRVRGMRRYAAMITLLLTLACGNAWGTSYTWTFTNADTKNDIDLASKPTDFTSGTGSKTLTYQGGSSCKIPKNNVNYLAMGGATTQSSNALGTRYFTLTAPSTAGTISVTYYTSQFGAAMIRTANGDYQVLSVGASEATRTSSVISGLTANTTTIYIGFKAKAYITSIVWTDADDPASMTTIYESDCRASMESGASISVPEGITEYTGGSGWVSAYAKYYGATSTNKAATITFSPALNLVSNGSNRGKIRIHYGSTGHSLDATVLNDFKINSGSSIGTAYGVMEKEKVHILEYDIPNGTETLSSVYTKIAVSNGCLLHIEVLTHSAAAGYTITYDCNEGTSGCPSTASNQTALPDPLPAGPTATGYTFGGWYTDEDLTVSAVAGAEIDDDVTLYAKMTPYYFNYNDDKASHYVHYSMGGNLSYTQALDGNSTYYFYFNDGGSHQYALGGPSTMTLASCTDWNFTIDYNTYCGITTKAPGNYVFTIDESDKANKLVVSVTYPDSVVITLARNDGSGTTSKWYAADGGTIPTPPDPSDRDGYAFEGWYSDAECTTPWVWSTTVNSATTLYAKWEHSWYYHGEWDDNWAAKLMTRSTNGTYWYWYTYASNDNRYFKIQQNGTWYNYTFNSPGYLCTDITMMNSNADDWEAYDSRCAVKYTSGRYYILVFPPNTSANSTDNPIICASTYLPEEYYTVPSSRTIYFDNSSAAWTNIYFRKGRTCHSEATALSLVPGTASLYKVTTASAYVGYQAFHLANNQSATGSSSIYTVNGGDKAITKATVFQKYNLDADVTFTPGDADGDPSDGCQYYDVEKTSGMKTDNVAITAPTNGTIRVSYTNTSGSSANFTSGNADLAHTCIITPEGIGDTGYEVSGMTINGSAHTSGSTYTITGATTIAATFSLIDYTVDYSTPSNGDYTIKVASGSASSADKTANYGQTITLAASASEGYHFTGWTITNTDNSTDITSLVSLSSQTENATFIMPAANISITATFAINTYTVTFAASPAGYGSVSPTSISSVNHGSTVSIASNVLTLKATDVTAMAEDATAAYTYAFNSWSVSDGAEITEAQTITATFTRTANSYDVTHSFTNASRSSGGSGGTDAATYGTDYTVVVAATSGCSLPSSITVTIGGDEATEETDYTWDKSTGTVTVKGASILDDIEIEIEAEADVTTYSVTYSKGDATGGTAPSDATAYDSGDEVTVKDTTGCKFVYAGHTFRGWTDGTTFYLVGQKFNITANTTLTAVWDAGASGGCETYFWFNSATDASNAGVTNSSKISTTLNTAANEISGSITIDGTEYTVTARTSNSVPACTIVVPSDSTGTFYMVAVSSGTGTRTVTTKKGDADAVNTDQVIAGSKTEGTPITIENLDPGTYVISASGNIGVGMMALKLCSSGGGGGSSGYTVSFANMTGFSGSTTLPSSIVGVPNGKKIVQPADPKASGYTFGGWYSNAACTAGNEINWGTMTITADKIIYAKWCATHTVTWIVNGETYTTGSPTTSTTDCDGITTMPTAPADNTLSGCANSFRGWSATNLFGEATNTQPADLFVNADDAPTIDADKTFYAVFGTATSAAYVGTVLWSEDWTGESADAKPSSPTTGGSVVYGTPTITYSYNDGTGDYSTGATKIYNENSAGGSKPELMVHGNTTTAGYFEIAGLPKAGSAALTLTFKRTNSTTSALDVSVTGTGYSISKVSGSGAGTYVYTITCGSAETFSIRFTGHGGVKSPTNTRIDDIVLKVKTDGATGYRCICPSLSVTPKLVTANTPIFITSAASKTVRSQDSLVIVGSGLQKNAPLSISSPASKFALKSRTNGALTTDETGAIDTVAYIYYTPGEGDTSDGLDKNNSFTITDGTNSETVSTALIGRHLPANFVIAAKVEDKWYALPADKANDTQDPVEITVDNSTTPTTATTSEANVYSWYGQPSITGDNGHTTRLEMHGIAPTGGSGHAPLFGSDGTGTKLGQSGSSTLSGSLGSDYWWIFTQTNTSVSATTDVKYNMTVANGNTKHVRIYNSKWGLYANGVDEIRLLTWVCSDPAAPTISGETAYSYGQTITLTASHDGSNHDEMTSYTWYKGADWATASAAEPVQATASGSAGYTLTIASCTTDDAGTYWCEASNGTCTANNSTGYTITVADPCFKATNLVQNDSWSNVAVNGFIDAAKVEGTITGGTIKNTGSADLGSNKKNANAGLVMDGFSKQVTVTLSGTNHLVVGSVITLTAAVSDGAESGTSKTSGLVVGGYDCSPASKSSETAYDSFTQSYTVTAGSSLVNANSFTIALKSGLAKTYLHAITVTGCDDCTLITPSLSYSKTSFWMDDATLTATATLTGYYGTPTITYTSSDPTVVRVDNASTGAITALKRGTATITATIGATTYSATDYCGATATCEITVKDMSCGNVEIAGVTLTANNAGTPSGSLIDSYGVLCEGDADVNGGYKIGKGIYYIYLTLSSGNYFQNGDKVKVFVTQPSSIGDSKGLYIYAGSTSAGTQVAFKANGDMTANAEAELELSNVPKNTSSITIHRNSGVQNPFIKYMKVNRYICPDVKEFLPEASTGDWDDTDNWIGSTGRGASLPTISDRVVISKPVTVDINDAKAKDVLVNQYSGATGKITVSAGKALIIAEKLQKTTTGSNRVATATTDVIINSDRTSAGVGALIIGGETGSNKATVNFETKVKRESGTGNWINQFIGSPFSDLTPYVDYALQIYEFRPAGGGNKGFWNKLSSGDAMTPFWGYNVLYNDNNYLDVTWTGTLNASSNNVTKTGSNAVQTDNLFANSWVAPIHIAEFEEDDFTNFDPTIYIFNAGTPQQEEAAGGIGSGSASASSAGTYAVLPIDAAPWVGMEVIPAMQAFFVKAEGASPTIKFDYSKLVYNPAVEDGVGIVPNRAPRRATAEEAPEVIRLRVTGENGWAENTYLLGREDFTEGYDRGWDGRYMEGEDTNPQLYAPTSDGNMAVNCVPQIDGTVLGFRKGNADSQYTFTFGYEGEEDYYLKDLKLNIETLIDGEHSYTFTAESGDNAARFMIVRRTPIITTGTAGIEAEASKARKIVYNDKVYIVRGGRIYSIDGAMVR